jgi:uncharacterized protein YjbJ (UPF0337 family)
MYGYQSPDVYPRTKETDMGEGALDKAKGKTKKAAGDLTGDRDLKNKGRVDKTSGKVKDKVGDAKGTAKDAIDRN